MTWDLLSQQFPAGPTAGRRGDLAVVGQLNLGQPERPGAIRPRHPANHSQVAAVAPHAETAPIGDDSVAKAVAALPFAGNTVGAAIVPFPRLKLEEYASLRAELGG
jgi:hypothetical protein